MPRGPAPLDRDALVRALEASRWVRSEAARRLGVSRQTVITNMRRYGLKKPASTRAVREAQREGGKIAGNGRPRHAA